MATPDVTGTWLRAHRSEATTRADLRDACCAATGKARHYVQGRIAEMMRDGRLAYLPPDYVDCRPRGTLAPEPTGKAAADAMRSALEREGAATPCPHPAPIGPGSALTEDALRGKIDVYYKARLFLEGVKEGLFYRLDDAAVAAGVPKGSASQVFGDPRFEAYRGQAVADQRTYIGHPARIAALKQEGILR